MSYRRPPPEPVEDYTNAFLVSAFVLLLTALIGIWALIGYAAALLTSAILNALIPGRRPAG